MMKSRFVASFAVGMTAVAIGACSSPRINRGVAASSPKPIQEVFEPAPPKNLDQHDKVAVIQWAPAGVAPLGASEARAERYKQSNRQALAKLVREAASKGAKLVVTSEFGIVGYPDVPELPSEDDNYRNPDDLRPFVEPIPGRTTQYFGALAKELSIYVHVGFAEVDSTTGKFYNSVAILGPDGALIGSYRKMNLYEMENQFLERGREVFTYESPWGKVGILICADVYSSFTLREYKQAKVDVLALSTSWAQMDTGMNFFRRGAAQVGAYLLAANQTYFPDSGVINPDGQNQSHIRQSEGIAYGYLPRKDSQKPR